MRQKLHVYLMVRVQLLLVEKAVMAADQQYILNSMKMQQLYRQEEQGILVRRYTLRNHVSAHRLLLRLRHLQRMIQSAQVVHLVLAR
jgi:hypothetical protein